MKRIILIPLDKASSYIFKHNDVAHDKVYSGLIVLATRLRAAHLRKRSSTLGNASAKRPKWLWLSSSVPFPGER
jgi:hypothetical protein